MDSVGRMKNYDIKVMNKAKLEYELWGAHCVLEPPVHWNVTRCTDPQELWVAVVLVIMADLHLHEWCKYGHAYEDRLCDEPTPVGHIAHEHVDDLTVEDFIEKYERPSFPVVISGIVDRWPAKHEWSIERLYERYRHRRFKCGEDDDGYPIKVKLKYFLRYVACQRDDSPLYIFDSGFEGDGRARCLMDDFTIPPYFRDDLFRLVGERRRPPYRWFLVGPKRSGTCVHIDPLGTSAWNALVSGRKRWVLFPPGTSKSLVKAKAFQKKDEDDEAIDYFNHMLPRMRAASGGDDALGTIEFVQRPGETVFIPGGWWHAVMNLDDTIAVTQNFASPVNFPYVWRATRSGRRGMARRWLAELDKAYPHLGRLARELDAADRYDLSMTAEEVRRRDRRRERRTTKLARGESVSSSPSDTSSDSSSSSSDESGSEEETDVSTARRSAAAGAGEEKMADDAKGCPPDDAAALGPTGWRKVPMIG